MPVEVGEDVAKIVCLRQMCFHNLLYRAENSRVASDVIVKDVF